MFKIQRFIKNRFLKTSEKQSEIQKYFVNYIFKVYSCGPMTMINQTFALYNNFMVSKRETEHWFYYKASTLLWNKKHVH